MTTNVSLQEANAADAARLDNLLQLYIHDLSALFPHVELNDAGRYTYAPLASYLTGAPERRAFLLRADGRLAGFALARRGSPALPEAEVWDVAEFFVLRRLRGAGIGRTAALRLWEQLGGACTVRVSNANVRALSFWRRAIAEYRGKVSELSWSPSTEPWTVFHLQPNDET